MRQTLDRPPAPVHGPETSSRWWLCGILIAATVAPAALLSWIVWRYGVDVPAHDSWHMVFMFRRFLTGDWVWNDLFGQVNESRLPLPKLMVFGLAVLTHWNVRAELFLQQGLVATLTVALYFVGRRTLHASLPSRLLVLAASSMLLFTPVQTQNPLWGIQFILFIPPLCLAGAALIAHARWSPWTRRIAALAACIVSMYSYANGLSLFALVPFIVEPVIALEDGPRERGRGARWSRAGAAFWVVCGVAALVAYFSGYQRPGYHPPMTVALERPLDALTSYVLYFGSLIYRPGTRRLIPFAFGMAELVLLAFVATVFVRHRRVPGLLTAAMPWLGFVGFGMGAGALIVAGRLGFSPDYSLSSRYAPFAASVTIGLVHLVTVVLTHPGGPPREGVARQMLAATGVVFAAVLVVLHAWASVAAMPEYRRLRIERLQAKAALWVVDVTPQPDLKRLVWAGSWQGSTADLGRWLDSRGYLRPPLLHDLAKATRDESLTQSFGWIDTVTDRPDGRLGLSGWCALPHRGEACDGVLVTALKPDGAEVPWSAVFPDHARPDAAASLKLPPSINVGWSASVKISPD
ncbi:MAG: hypothetical protein EHM24_05440, partial [Acidobacteria bacterium]